MRSIQSTIKSELSSGRKVLSVFLTTGFPSMAGFTDLVHQILEAGADMVELGIPFSDPIADGPVIQYSSQIALANGVNIEKVFNVVEDIKRNSNKPLILMGYANPIQNYGLENFIKSCKQINVDGLIVPDIPIEEYDDFFSENMNGLDVILLVSPTSENERIRLIGNKSEGFVYCVSVKGITGERNFVSDESIKYIQKVKRILPDKNILVGFGVSSPQIARTYAEYSDGVIVGSAIVKLLSENKIKEAIDLVSSIKNEMNF
jgi:tryptophan synthase alpha chain